MLLLHLITLTDTLSRTSLDGRSALHRDFYLHNTQHSQQTDRHPRPQRDLNQQSRPVNSRRPTPETEQLMGSAITVLLAIFKEGAGHGFLHLTFNKRCLLRVKNLLVKLETLHPGLSPTPHDRLQHMHYYSIFQYFIVEHASQVKSTQVHHIWQLRQPHSPLPETH